tara:strand:- start:1361 stop:1507 length:147 start_codon:yes stop_codon:yes gene_type:complete
MTEPKFKPSFDGCYNYKKLKEEGLIEETETKSEDEDSTTDYHKIPHRY